ncbi:hypothetical protein ABIB00_007893 [Bradyrhizobium sp. LB14.3]|uniref:hypothetical protein n=1 Tax=Bradyrhizobium sp. LB14.3 TaxID=3156328 RepID=UPI0033960CCC
MVGKIGMGARREIVSAATERYRVGQTGGEGRILDALCATTGWHRKHAVRALGQHEPVRSNGVEARESAAAKYGATINDALTACGRRRIGFAASGSR